MSDTTGAYPPPPPPSAPPPSYQVAPSPLPNYQPPAVSQPPVGYPQNWQVAPPQLGVGAGWGAVGILAQFEPPALWAIIAGLVTIVVPFMFGRVFFFLPIIAVITGVRAIQGGKLIGGIVGIVLGVIGGIITLIGLFG